MKDATTSCDQARQVLLDPGLDEEKRERTFAALVHVNGCQDCQAALRDFDRIREVFASCRSDADPPGGWQAFEERMTCSRRLQMRRAPRRWDSVAASVLIGGLMFIAGGELRPAASVVAAATAPFDPADLPHKFGAFERIAKQFDGRASWVMLANDNDAADMGTSSERLDQNRQLLLLRLTMTRQSGEVSDADVLIVPGQTADTNVPLAPGQSLHYRIVTSKDDPTRLSLWLEVQTSHGRHETLATLSTNLQVKPGQSLSAGHLVTSAGEYGLRIGVAEARPEPVERASSGGERS